MMHKANRWTRAVSLVEILTVIALLAVVTGMGARIANSCVRLWRTQSEHIRARQAAWHAVMTVSGELMSAVGTDFEGKDSGAVMEDLLTEEVLGDPSNTSTRVGNDELTFVIPGAGVGREAALRVVCYRIDKDDKGKLIGLRRREKYVGEEWTVASPVLMRGGEYVVELDAQYMRRGDQGGTWVDEWTDSSALPAAIRVKIGSFVRYKGGVRALRHSSVVVLRQGTRIAE